MVDNPLLVLLAAGALFLVLLVLFTLATYLYLKMAVKINLALKKRKW